MVQIDEEQGEGLDHQEVSNAEVDKQHVAAGSQNGESSNGNIEDLNKLGLRGAKLNSS